MAKIKFKSGVSVEVENIRQILVIDVQDLQRHYGQLLAREIEGNGPKIKFLTKKFDSCSEIIGLLEDLKEVKTEQVLMKVSEFTADQIEELIKDNHKLLSLEVAKYDLTNKQIDGHPITKKILELEAAISKERVDKIYADFLAA